MTSLTELANRLYGDDLSRKPPSYLVQYERLLAPRERPIRLLELGVQRGISMRLWREYLPKAIVVGIDCDPPPDFPDDPRFRFLLGSQDDPRLLDEARDWAAGEFDLIIDDASHQGALTGRSFAHLFPRHLRPGGHYVIEDICTTFSPGNDFDGTQYSPAEIGLPGWPLVFPSHHHGMIGLVKQLFDHAMAPTAVGGYTRFAILGMTVISNMVVIEKGQ